MEDKFSKPQVTIDLEEYLFLKARSEREELLPFLKMGQQVGIETPGLQITGKVTQVNNSNMHNPIYWIATSKGIIQLSVNYNN